MAIKKARLTLRPIGVIRSAIKKRSEARVKRDPINAVHITLRSDA